MARSLMRIGIVLTLLTVARTTCLWAAEDHPRYASRAAQVATDETADSVSAQPRLASATMTPEPASRTGHASDVKPARKWQLPHCMNK